MSSRSLTHSLSSGLLFISSSVFLVLFIEPFSLLCFSLSLNVNGLSAVLYSFLKSTEYSHDHCFNLSIPHVTYISFAYIFGCGLVLFFHLGQIPLSSDIFQVFTCFCELRKSAMSSILKGNGFLKKSSCSALRCSILCPQDLALPEVSPMCVACPLLLCPGCFFRPVTWSVFAFWGQCLVPGLNVMSSN